MLSINNSNLSSDGGATNSDNNDLFGMEMLYDQAEAGLSNSPYYNGQLSAVKWLSRDANGNPVNQRNYNYAYDQLNRLTGAYFQEKINNNWNGSGGFDEKNITYDENGNILALQRNALTVSNAVTPRCP